ncbi:hypothetical protein KA107_02880 [Candidatus Pacearchaeota archaeon]|nr:hypothetical protein [Candidatus Pacearchaeota archaeon]
MSRLWIFLNKYGTLRQNRKLIQEVCRLTMDKQLEDFHYFLEYIPELRRVRDEETFLETFTSNLKRKHWVKFAFGNTAPEHPLELRLAAGEVLIPGKDYPRLFDSYCPWTTQNYEKIDGVFRQVYNKGIIDFPIKR